MRAVVNVEEIQGRTCLVVTELPYQVNPDNLSLKIAELVNSGRVQGIADLRDDTSDKTGLRIVIILQPRRRRRRSCSTTCTSTPSCRTRSARTCSRSSTACRAR